jgi:alcohol dehydrogenase
MAVIGELITGQRGDDERETGLMGIAELENFFNRFAIPHRLRDLVPDARGLPEVCKLAVQDACVLTNPRPVTWEDCLQICEEVW